MVTPLSTAELRTRRFASYMKTSPYNDPDYFKKRDEKYWQDKCEQDKREQDKREQESKKLDRDELMRQIMCDTVKDDSIKVFLRYGKI